jgi:putative transcriptional regulator
MTEYHYYERLKESLEQAAAYQSGDKSKASVSVRSFNVPEYRADDVTRLRSSLRLSQSGLAYVLGVSARTVEAWESGRNKPCGSSKHLLYLFEKDNSLVSQFVE